MANSVMQKWYEAAKTRSSVRNYTGSVDKDTFYELKGAASRLCNDDARIELRAKNGVLIKPVLSQLLGGVEGTNCFAAIIVRNGNNYMGGYVGEAFVLECASRGIGTCWLGASFKRSAVRQFIDIDENETLIAVIAFGRTNGFPKPPAKKSAEQLTGLETEAIKALPEWQQEAIRIAKLAPSARNKQPWDIEVKKDMLGIVCNSSNFGYGDVDCGIAMLHIELGAGMRNVYGDWDMKGATKYFVPYENTVAYDDKE